MKEVIEQQRSYTAIKNVMSDFLSHCRYEKRLSEKTIKAYKVDGFQFETFVYGDFNVTYFEHITKEMIKRYIQTISTFKPKTIKRKIASLKALFSYYEYENDLFVNPIRKIRLQVKEPKVLPVVMHYNEVEQILRYLYEIREENVKPQSYTYLARTRDVCMIEVLFATGIRVAELCSLSCNDIDLENGVLKVNGKGSKERIIQICSSEVLDILKEYYALVHPQTFFFVNRLGNRMSEQSVRLLIKKCVTGLQMNKRVTPHTFRHTFATLLLERGVDIKYIQNLLGHSSIVTTQIYTHVNMNMQKEILQSKHPRNGLRLIGFKRDVDTEL